jgi:hypothetical protein
VIQVATIQYLLGTNRATRPTAGDGASQAIVLILIVLALAGCGRDGPPSGTGDPGNKRLEQLVADGVFATLPPDAHQSGPTKKTPAKYRTPAFQPAGWDGPAVQVTFTDSQPPETVFSFYATSAVRAGWSPNPNRNSLGYTEVWTKTFPGSWSSTLGLIDMSSRTVKPGEAHVYVLTASAPAISSR